jgi:uncharacterized small protein (DUF1192 family)
MDKASIVGDALLYVQELQTKAKKLKAEIAGLEASLLGSERYHQAAGGSTDDQSPKKIQLLQNEQYPICKNVIQMDVFQVEERGFYVRLVCEKGVGVALSLYKALESLTGFIVQSSNLATVSERFVLTFTLNVCLINFLILPININSSFCLLLIIFSTCLIRNVTRWLFFLMTTGERL